MIEREHLLRQLDMRDVEESAERMVIEMDNRPDLVNVRGALQGGLVATLIDIAAGRLAGNVVGPDRDVTTADMNVHFLAPIVEGRPAPRRPSCGPAVGWSSRPSTSSTSAGTASLRGRR